MISPLRSQQFCASAQNCRLKNKSSGLFFNLTILSHFFLPYHPPDCQQEKQLPSVETMQAPWGVWGVHTLPNSGHSCGRILPINTCAQQQAGFPLASYISSALPASKASYSFLSFLPEPAITPIPRPAASQNSKKRSTRSRASVFPSSVTAEGYIFSTRPCP